MTVMVRSMMLGCGGVLALLAAGCGGGPGGAEVGSPAYRADLDTCGTSVAQAVNKRNAKTGLAWMASGVTRWSEIDGGVAACMEQKGWGRERACTEAERVGGNRTRSLVVTAQGVRCVDPGRRS